MEENKSEQEILASFERELNEKLQETKGEIERVKYYERFTINGVDFNNIFITAEKDVDGNITYHMYSGDSSKEIISIGSDGKVETKNPELKKYLGEVDLEKSIAENERGRERQKGISEKATPKQTKKQEKDDSDEKKDENTQQIEADLAAQGEEVRIGKHREIKDDKIAERMPEVFEKGKKYEIAEDRVTGEAMIIEKENGRYKKNEKVEKGETATQRVFSIEPNGELNESEIPDQSMRVKNNPQIELESNEDEYGDLEMQTVHVTPCQSRIARPVQMQGQTPEEHQEQKEVTDTFAQKGGEQLADEIAHKKKELEETYNVTETHIEELRELDIEAVMEAEAQKAKISKEGFKEYVKKADGKTLQDKINNAHEEIEQEYMGGQRPR